MPLGPVCSSWIFLSRSSSKRSVTYPTGWEERSWVEAGNIMAARVALLIMLIVHSKCTYVLEQPPSSLFRSSLRMQEVYRLLRRANVTPWQITVDLGAFGSLSPKPVTLDSNNRGLLDELWRPRLRCASSSDAVQLVRRTISKDGKPQITGNRAALRASQCQPYQYSIRF